MLKKKDQEKEKEKKKKKNVEEETNADLEERFDLHELISDKNIIVIKTQSNINNIIRNIQITT